LPTASPSAALPTPMWERYMGRGRGEKLTKTAYYQDALLRKQDATLRKTILFLQEWRFGRSRSSKVIDVGTNESAYVTSYISP